MKELTPELRDWLIENGFGCFIDSAYIDYIDTTEHEEVPQTWEPLGIKGQNAPLDVQECYQTILNYILPFDNA